MTTELNFNIALKKIQQEGTLAWEYNPFRNYRLNEDMIYYKNRFYTILEFVNKYYHNNTESAEINEDGNITYKVGTDNKTITNWSNKFPKTEETPVFYQKGQLVDFITNELQFDLNHPVQITPQYSYDNSVDLIINDNISKPKIINSRFSAIGKNKYKIVDRNGNNDTNIYDRGTEFEIDTSLYKITTQIPKLTFSGVTTGGNLKIGNYHFYFKYSDLDGNESDFVAQSGLVSIFIGNSPNSIHTGFSDQNSHKLVRFLLSNIDKSYDYIIVYYSRASSQEFESRTTEYCKIEQKFKVSTNSITVIDITGFETTTNVAFEEINERLQIYDSAKTQAVAQNRLFLGNVTSSNVNHNTLSRLALYFVPSLDISKECKVDQLSYSYRGDISNTYYNPSFIYNYTGYWDDEIYRFGIVFIKNNNTLTPVYDIRGYDLSNKLESFKTDFYEKDDLITYDETTFEINSKYKLTENDILENARGVCYIPGQNKLTNIIGIKVKTVPAVIEYLKELNIKGYFIVRQKRIPTTLCQAYTIGIESESHIPVIPNQEGKYVYESFLSDKSENYVYFEDGKKKSDTGYLLTNIYDQHKREIEKTLVVSTGAICPDYDVNYPYYNSLFTGSDFIVQTRQKGSALTENGRLFYTSEIDTQLKNNYYDVKIIGVEDNVKLVGIGDDLFAARAGEAEEAHRYAHVGTEIKTDHGGNNLVRGSYGPYLGISDYKDHGDLITIKIPGYNVGNMRDYFKIRYNDASMFYPISDRFTFNDLDYSGDSVDLGIFYRGDCYISRFTHRVNRNFTDETVPTNNVIVDPACWSKCINFEDQVLKTDDLDKINRGDVNSVNLGIWVQFIVRSNYNHSVRSLNESNVDETQLMGNCRGFYPYHPLSAVSAFKLPEAGVINSGFEATVGEQVFEQLPIVPYWKDIYSTRIAYSNLQITSAFKNAYRVFKSTNYRDYPITYGEITKIIEWNGDLICVLEHGVYKIPINERTVAGDGSGGSVYINTSNVLPENPLVISDTFGSQWSDSIIKTPTAIYGVDTVGKKIWRVDNNGMELISDFKVQEFLNNNITFTERELTPIIGQRNVKTHYNAFKHDVMFTFYDDLNGLSECVWNLCWNETLNKWITFYSWVPSFSENIYNTYFSFDRETSKQIAKLFPDKTNSDYSIYIDNSQMSEIRSKLIGTLQYDSKYEGNDIEISCKWELIRDQNNNYTAFKLDSKSGNLTYTKDYSKYIFTKPDEITYKETQYTISNNKWYNGKTEITDQSLIIELNKERNRIFKESFNTNDLKNNSLSISLKSEFKKQKVYTLNVRVTPTITYKGKSATYAEYVSSKNTNLQLNKGYIERTIAVIPKEHLETLSTDFWRHGQSGIFDITEDVKPTKWYGKQHPFEFEFIVRDSPDTHKIFDNLLIISNKAAPESFHYEIIGECYEFAEDKKNMYIRQEATKELFQQCGNNIEFNSDYKTLESEHRKMYKISDAFEKSTIFPAYYLRQDSLNTIEDYYHSRQGSPTYNYKDLCGAELVYYKTLNEFRIWNHSRAVDMKEGGPLRGNMRYSEDKWKVQISPINLVQCNELDWGINTTGFGIFNSNKVPVEIKQANFLKLDSIEPPTDVSPLNERGLVIWNNSQIRRSEIKLKDKYIKIRIRYSGEDLAVISAIKTLYSISYA